MIAFRVEIYGRVRRAVRVEGRSQRAVAREFGLSRETVRKRIFDRLRDEHGFTGGYTIVKDYVRGEHSGCPRSPLAVNVS
jgi:DNA-binding Lrp family transcriptional regulator